MIQLTMYAVDLNLDDSGICSVCVIYHLQDCKSLLAGFYGVYHSSM